MCREFTGHRWIPRTKTSALIFSLICTWINGWAINREAGDLRRYRTHYDVPVMYWPYVLGIHRSPVNSRCKCQWREALMFSLICAWIKGWANNREVGDLRHHRAQYDVTVMLLFLTLLLYQNQLITIFSNILLQKFDYIDLQYSGITTLLLTSIFMTILHVCWYVIRMLYVRFHQALSKQYKFHVFFNNEHWIDLRKGLMPGIDLHCRISCYVDGQFHKSRLYTHICQCYEFLVWQAHMIN